ncbi:MAG: segregation/condensation protein A [Spirochaetia bacterium]|jgi:segregation and condensation protein A|nr:segregation/condensation protein A [Spirochaetia bacterium]
MALTELVDSYLIHIERFEGPLDVLWDLIKKSKIDITEISISEITEQYIAYLKLMEQMNVHIASEFIWTASELLYYKSRAILPSADIEDEYFVQPLPGELIQKLLEYKKFQRSSLAFKEAYDLQANVFTSTNIIEGTEEIAYTSVSLFDLLKAFAKVMDSGISVEHEEIVFDEILVSDRIEYIISFLKEKESVVFTDIFCSIPTRAEVIASLLAVLEMIKIKMIKVIQDQIFGELLIIRSFSSEQI